MRRCMQRCRCRQVACRGEGRSSCGSSDCLSGFCWAACPVGAGMLWGGFLGAVGGHVLVSSVRSHANPRGSGHRNTDRRAGSRRRRPAREAFFGAATAEVDPAEAAQPAPLPPLCRELQLPPGRRKSCSPSGLHRYRRRPALKLRGQTEKFSPPRRLPTEPSSFDRAWNWLTGGNALVRVGVVVLFFGVAFLLKYAYEHTHVPIEVRLIGVALGAVVMLVIGWRLRQRSRSMRWRCRAAAWACST